MESARTSAVNGSVGMKSVVVVGAQWGDEGKGKVVDYLAGSFDYIARVARDYDPGRPLTVAYGETASPSWPRPPGHRRRWCR